MFSRQNRQKLLYYVYGSKWDQPHKHLIASTKVLKNIAFYNETNSFKTS